MSEAERILNAGRVKDEEGKLDEAFALYQQGMEMLMDKLKQPAALDAKDRWKQMLAKYLDRAEVIKKKQSKIPLIQEIRIQNDDTGWSYHKLFNKVLADKPTHVRIQDPYLAARHQLGNLVKLCELLTETKSVTHIRVITKEAPVGEQRGVQQKCMRDLGQSLEEQNIVFVTNYSETLHDREIRFKNDANVIWVAILGRGLDFYKKTPSWFSLGVYNYGFRKCHECTITLTRG